LHCNDKALSRKLSKLLIICGKIKYSKDEFCNYQWGNNGEIRQEMTNNLKELNI